MRITESQLRRIIRQEHNQLHEGIAYIGKKEVDLDNYKDFSQDDLQKMIERPEFKQARLREIEDYRKQGKKGTPPLTQLEDAIYSLQKSRGAKDAEEARYRRNAEDAKNREKNADERAKIARADKLIKQIEDIFSKVGNQENMIKMGKSSSWPEAIRAHAKNAGVNLSDPSLIKRLNDDYYKISDGPLKKQRLGDALTAALAGKLEGSGFFKKVFGESEIRQMIRQEMHEAQRRRR